VKTNLARVSRNDSEEIHVSLREINGRPYVELRVCNRADGHGPISLPAEEAITIPVNMLSDLCRLLAQTQYRLALEEQGQVLSFPSGTPKGAGTPANSSPAGQRDHRHSRRREPRVPIRLPAKCYLLGAPHSAPSRPKTAQVAGQIWDVSSGGAQVWLPERFPVMSRLAIVMPIGEPMFRGHGEVLAATLQARGGRYRHNIRWLPLNTQAKVALSKLIGPRR
jgi:hypothetical protein